MRVIFIMVGMSNGKGGGNKSVDSRSFSCCLRDSLSLGMVRLDIDLALCMFDRMLFVEFFHFSAPIFALALMMSTLSVRRCILLEVSSLCSFSCLSDVGPQQQQYQVWPNHDLRFGQKHRMRRIVMTMKVHATRIKNGFDLNGWKASYVNSAFVGT